MQVLARHRGATRRTVDLLEKLPKKNGDPGECESWLGSFAFALFQRRNCSFQVISSLG